MIQKYDHECGCTVTVYGDNSAPPDVEYCSDHGVKDPATEIFDVMLGGGDANRQKAAELIRQLSDVERRDFRAALQECDELLDDVILAEMRASRPWKI